MSAIERSLYVAVGAADLAVEKVQQLPPVKTITKLRETSIIDQAREFEPKLRKQAKELQARGEVVVKRFRKDAAKARKQVSEFPVELRGRIEKAVGRGNGDAKPASKTSAKAGATKS